MATAKLLILLAFVSLVLSNELEDAEQKKRALEKGTNLNTIPSGGGQKDYSYIYQQPTQVPLTQPPSSFYPNVQNNQYYNHGEQQLYQPQPQLNYVPQNPQQFVPLNFIPNPGYQAKYQIVPKGVGNIQLAVIPQPGYLSPPPVFQPQVYHSHNQNAPQGQYQTLSPQQYQVPQGYVNQQFQYSQPYIGQPSMLLYAQAQAQSPYNYLYSNAGQQLYNYFQTNPQAKYQLLYGNQVQPQGQVNPQQQQTVDYEKPLSSPYTQSGTKDDNDLSNDYITPAESTSSYKNAYAGSRTSSYKSR